MIRRRLSWRRAVAVLGAAALLSSFSHPGRAPERPAAQSLLRTGEMLQAPRRLTPPAQPSLEQILLMMGVLQQLGG